MFIELLHFQNTVRFMELDLPEHDRMIINYYIACLQTVDCRYADISYMAGIEDAITFLKKMDLETMRKSL